MVPQLFIGSLVRRMPVRKYVWVAGSVGQCLCVAGIGLVALFLEGVTAGWILLGLVVLFSLARGFCSVAAKDVLGKTVPRGKRGQLMGWSASAAGLVSIGVGVTLMLPFAERLDRSLLGVLLIGTGCLWLVAAFAYAQIKEFAGETGGGRNAVEALRQLGILRSDRQFRHFVITRALLMCSALSAPFYVALAQGNLGSSVYMLGAFVVAAGLASLVSGPVWGRLADVSSRKVMITAGMITSGIGLLTFLLDTMLPNVIQSVWFLPFAYFVLSIAHDGVRVGRKTFIVNLAGGNRRTDYVAISNSVIGVLLLVVGSIGTLAPVVGMVGVIGILALMGLGGALLGSKLPEV
jgi:MFS family permease